jgi:hypothetical protein
VRWLGYLCSCLLAARGSRTHLRKRGLEKPPVRSRQGCSCSIREPVLAATRSLISHRGCKVGEG